MVVETSRPIADVARELGVSETSLGNWVRAYREKHAEDEPPLQLSERARLRERPPAPRSSSCRPRPARRSLRSRRPGRPEPRAAGPDSRQRPWRPGSPCHPVSPASAAAGSPSRRHPGHRCALDALLAVVALAQPRPVLLLTSDITDMARLTEEPDRPSAERIVIVGV